MTSFNSELLFECLHSPFFTAANRLIHNIRTLARFISEKHLRFFFSKLLSRETFAGSPVLYISGCLRSFISGEALKSDQFPQTDEQKPSALDQTQLEKEIKALELTMSLVQINRNQFFNR